MRLLSFLLGLLLALPAAAIDIGAMPNPSYYNPDWGVAQMAPGPYDVEVIAASKTDEPCGVVGAAGDYLSHVIIFPATTAAGAVSIEDGSGTNYTLHPGGGTTALIELKPIVIPLGLVSQDGAWEITTGTNVSVWCFGFFTDA